LLTAATATPSTAPQLPAAAPATSSQPASTVSSSLSPAASPAPDLTLQLLSLPPCAYSSKKEAYLLSFPIPPLATCPVLRLPVCTSLQASLFWKLAIQHHHPHPTVVFQLIQDIQRGFPIGLQQHSIPPPRAQLVRNLPSITPDRHSWVDEHMQAESSIQRRAGPFPHPPYPNMVISPIGLVPKRSDPSSFRVIHHLSWPRSNPSQAVNAHIHPAFIKVQLQSFDQALNHIVQLRAAGARKVYLCKIDIKAAYRLLGVQPSEWPLLGMHWKSQFYFDKVLPMGLSSSCRHWERVATLAQWIVQQHIGVERMVHYIDDYLLFSTDLQVGAEQRDQSVQLFNDLGVIVANEKVEGPSELLVHLGILVDTASMTIGLDPQRLAAFKALLSSLLGQPAAPTISGSAVSTEASSSSSAAQPQRVSLRSLLSIIGKLSWACRVIRAGRTFLRRLINYTAMLQRKINNLEAKVAVSDECKKDLQWWLHFLNQYDEQQRLPIVELSWIDAASTLHLYTDASEKGAGAVFGSHWWSHVWSSEELANAQRKNRISMPYLECRALLLAVCTWAPALSNKNLLFHVDCEPIVKAVQKGDSREKELMQLIRTLSFIAAQHHFAYSLKHVAGVTNVAADLLSRLDVQTFQRQFRSMDSEPCPIAAIPACPW
jgi:hypothetical protein